MSENETKVNELNEALKELWDSLTDEQKEKAKECKSMDELMLLAGKMRIELPDELLEEVAGGTIVKHNDGTYQCFRHGGNPFLIGEPYQTLEEAKEAHAKLNPALVGAPAVVDQSRYDYLYWQGNKNKSSC